LCRFNASNIQVLRVQDERGTGVISSALKSESSGAFKYLPFERNFKIQIEVTHFDLFRIRIGVWILAGALRGLWFYRFGLGLFG